MTERELIAALKAELIRLWEDGHEEWCHGLTDVDGECLFEGSGAEWCHYPRPAILEEEPYENADSPSGIHRHEG